MRLFPQLWSVRDVMHQKNFDITFLPNALFVNLNGDLVCVVRVNCVTVFNISMMLRMLLHDITCSTLYKCLIIYEVIIHKMF